MSFTVLLVRPNISIRKGFDLQNRLYPPLGLAYLAGSLVQSGHTPVILDMVAENPEKTWPYRDTHTCYGIDDAELVLKIEEIKPDIIGVSGFTAQHTRIVEIVNSVKKAFPLLPVVLGGIHASSLPDLLMAACPADYLLRGESDRSFVELVDCLERNDSILLRKIDGLVFRDGNAVVINPKNDVISDLDSIPFPARELLPNNIYIRNNISMPVITSRGCPYQCVFCCVSLTQGNKWRSREPKKVVDEIEGIVKTWGYKVISFFDDAFNIDPNRVISICKQIVDRKLGIHLLVPSSLMIKHITRDTLYWLKQAGCIAISLPFEHSDEQIRNAIINKGLTLEKFDEVLQWCREIGLLTLVNFVIGLPGETEETLISLNEYIKRNFFKMDALAIYIGTPFPGTPFYETCLAKGYLVKPEKNDFLDFDLYDCLINTSFINAETVMKYKKLIDSTFIGMRSQTCNNELVRRAIRRPDDESMEYIETVYLKEKDRLWEEHSLKVTRF